MSPVGAPRHANVPPTVSWVECTTGPPNNDCAEGDLNACAHRCGPDDVMSCFMLLDREPARARAREVIEADCHEDPVCGCARLGYVLLRTRDDVDRRRGLELSRASCERGALMGCDDFELERSLCLSQPEGATCTALRERGELPEAPPPLDELFGCRSTTGPLGPHALVCLDQSHVSIRDASHHWEQWTVTSWHRDDTTAHAIWRAQLVDGASVALTVLEPEPAPEATPSWFGPPHRVHRVHIVAGDGLINTTLALEYDDEATHALESMATVERVCDGADRCEMALLQRAADSRAPTVDPEGSDEYDGEGSDEYDGAELMPSAGPRTLRHCHDRWQAAVDAAVMFPTDSIPSACGTVHTDMGIPFVDPPYPDPYPFPYGDGFD